MYAAAVIHRLRFALALALVCTAACGSDYVPASASEDRPIAILSAFPAEMVPVLERTTVETSATVNGHNFRIGTLAGRRVIVGLTGIGLLNAAATTRALLEQFEVGGVVVSAVAGSTQRIGDVVAPESWSFKNGPSFAADARWLQAARALAELGDIGFSQCTVLPNEPERGEVCVSHHPALFVGGLGQSSDSFGNTPLACQPGGDDVFGCDIPQTPAVTNHRLRLQRLSSLEMPAATDMESAAIAREAEAHGVRFIAFRGVSDGSGDPLGLPGFPAPFLAYYRLAAHNAAAAAAAFVAQLPAR